MAEGDHGVFLLSSCGWRTGGHFQINYREYSGCEAFVDPSLYFSRVSDLGVESLGPRVSVCLSV